MFIGRKTRVTIVIAGFVVSLIAGAGHRSIARADDPPKGPTPDEMIAGMKEGFEEIGQGLGGFTADEKTKLAAYETKLADQMKTDPKKAMSKEFEESSMKDFEDILTPEHKKAFEKLMAGSKAREVQVKTESHLHQIGLLSLMYTGGKNAPDLGALASQPDVTPDIFLTADSKTTAPADWKTMDAKAKADWVNKNTDFVYLAGTQTGDLPANFVMAHVKPDLAPDGNIFLMGDRRVETKTADESKAILADLKGGKNPPPSMK